MVQSLMRLHRIVGMVPSIRVRAIVEAAGLDGTGPGRRLVSVTVEDTVVFAITVIRRQLARGGYRWESRCPHCWATRRQLYFLVDQLRCRDCHQLRYPSWALSRTTWLKCEWRPLRRDGNLRAPGIAVAPRHRRWRGWDQ